MDDIFIFPLFKNIYLLKILINKTLKILIKRLPSHLFPISSSSDVNTIWKSVCISPIHINIFLFSIMILLVLDLQKQSPLHFPFHYHCYMDIYFYWMSFAWTFWEVESKPSASPHPYTCPPTIFSRNTPTLLEFLSPNLELRRRAITQAIELSKPNCRNAD